MLKNHEIVAFKRFPNKNDSTKENILVSYVRPIKVYQNGTYEGFETKDVWLSSIPEAKSLTKDCIGKEFVGTFDDEGRVTSFKLV